MTGVQTCALPIFQSKAGIKASDFYEYRSEKFMLMCGPLSDSVFPIMYVRQERARFESAGSGNHRLWWCVTPEAEVFTSV